MLELAPPTPTDPSASPVSGCSGGQSPASIKRTVVIVEDEVGLRKLLRRYGVNTFDGSDWATGNEFLAALDTHHPPDLLVIDLNLPGLSGIEVIEAIRMTIPGNRRPKILLISGMFLHAGDEEFAFTGADDCLAKPFTRVEFLDRIHQLLGRKTNPLT